MRMSASQPTSHQNQTAADRMQAEADRMQAEADRMQAEAARMQAEADRMQPEKADTSSDAMTNLRGSSVGKVNTRKVGQVILIMTLVALLVLATVFFVAGVHRNNQISGLHDHGVAAVMTVTGCALLIGGSGSTPAGDACQGTFSLDGHRYAEAIPGLQEYKTGRGGPHRRGPKRPRPARPRERLGKRTFFVDRVHPSGLVLLVAFFLLLLGWVVVVRRHRAKRLT